MPAAAVKHREQVLSGIIGCKECVGVLLSLKLKPQAQLEIALDTGRIECIRG